MVTISCEPDVFSNGVRYKIESTVPHEWARKKFDKINGHGHGSLTTAYDDVTLISLSDSDPKFKENLVFIIKECTNEELNQFATIELEIQELEKRKAILKTKIRGKYWD